MAQKNEHHGSIGENSTHQPSTSHAETFPEQQYALDQITQLDPWSDLKQFTQARIALGRTGCSLPTKAVLEFNCAHAMARDAVHLALDSNKVEAELNQLGFNTLQVNSRALDRHSFLLRPDLGRRLNAKSADCLKTHALTNSKKIDLLLVIGDGLSSMAIAQHAVKVIAEIQSQLPTAWNLGPIIIAQQARVALADEIGEIYNANAIAILIGERPGLSSPDSLGIYFTHAAKLGCTDADRNCISNVRPQGLSYAMAATKLLWLSEAARRSGFSGVKLKDQSDTGGFLT